MAYGNQVDTIDRWRHMTLKGQTSTRLERNISKTAGDAIQQQSLIAR